MRNFMLITMFAVLSIAAQADAPDRLQLRGELLGVLDNYLSAVNRVELKAVTDTYHFPHYRIVNNQVVVWQTPAEAMPMLGLPHGQQVKAMREALGPDWQRTDWAYRKLLSLSDTKAHFETELVRYNSKGEEISRFESLYILTKEQGRWAIKARSSFAPR